MEASPNSATSIKRCRERDDSSWRASWTDRTGRSSVRHHSRPAGEGRTTFASTSNPAIEKAAIPPGALGWLRSSPQASRGGPSGGGARGSTSGSGAARRVQGGPRGAPDAGGGGSKPAFGPVGRLRSSTRRLTSLSREPRERNGKTTRPIEWMAGERSPSRRTGLTPRVPGRLRSTRHAKVCLMILSASSLSSPDS